jgi:acetolactate synthase-1/3 small subunit
MPEFELVVVAAPGRDVPARVTTLLLPPDIEMIGMQFSHPPDSEVWWVQLAVRVPSRERLELLIGRLNRLVDVFNVVVLDPDDDCRQSVYVRTVTAPTDLIRIVELTARFHAEIVETHTDAMVLHLNATPEQCATFVSTLRYRGAVEVTTNDASGFSTESRPTSRPPRAAAHAY